MISGACRATRSSISSRTSPPATTPFVVHDDGYRDAADRRTGRSADAARAFAGAAGCARASSPDDKVVIWSENRAEWVVALWGCLLAGVVLVPVDYRASADLLTRIAQIVQAKVGARRRRGASCRPRRRPATSGSCRRHRLMASRRTPAHGPAPGDPRTSEPGHDARRDHLHVRRDGRSQGRHDHASQHPREHHPDRAGDREVPQVHAAVPSDSVPESAAAQPHVRPVDGDVRAADAVAAPSSSRTATARPRSSGRSSRAASRCSCACRRCSTCCASTSSASLPITAEAGRARGQALVLALVALPRRASALRLEVLVHRLRRGAARSGARSVLAQARLSRRAGLRPHRNRADRHAESSVRASQRHGRHADRRRRGEDRAGRRDSRPRRQRHVRLLPAPGGSRRRPSSERLRRSRTAGSTPATSASSTRRAGC